MADMILDIGSGKRSYNLSNGNTVMLDPNDMNIIARYNECMQDFSGMESAASALEAARNSEGEDTLAAAGTALRELDDKMRAKLDYLFDADVSAACAGNASMFDVVGGEYRFERIVTGLLKAYEDSITKEIAGMKSRVAKAKPAKYRKHV